MALVEVSGLREISEAALNLRDIEMRKEWRDAARSVADLVVRKAQAEASRPIERIASRQGLSATMTQGVPAVRLSNKQFPGTFGAEFGADRNQLRLVKNTGGRPTVANRDSVDVVTRRIEAQTVTFGRSGATVRKRTRGAGGVAVRVKGRMLGWNQFQPWSRSGNFLFPAIGKSSDEILAAFGDAVEQVFGTKG
ncbi:hypothetical protein EBZ38_15345 [bacterium]|nr:hypothetical protein [bacterium]NDC95880.1 hypothetical protein [bacterium]NDD85635.1 hypothetical protein [bacterium]NDG19862.1 hypothetical protein [Betaproteobacteria bacterium]